MTENEAISIVDMLFEGYEQDATVRDGWLGVVAPLSWKAARSAVSKCRRLDAFPSFGAFLVFARQAEEKLSRPPILGLPVSDKFTARPVWDRFERRRRLDPLLPPTAAECHDAILVLEENMWDGGETTPRAIRDLALEAERIFVEAGL